MEQENAKSAVAESSPRRFPGYMEATFDVLYLLAALSIGGFILLGRRGDYFLGTGSMALLLAGGDAFHLVPRIGKALTGDGTRFQQAQGMGKAVTSVTMTVFYSLLWLLGTLLFPDLPKAWTLLAGCLTVLRLALCIAPQNRWTDIHPPRKWVMLRNIPFALLGCMTTVLFFINRAASPALSWLWLASLLSFAFYIPVVLGAGKYPILGMLMLPKTCMYLWMLWMLAAL